MEPFARTPRRLLSDDQMPTLAKVIYGILDSYLDKRSGDCRVSIERLMAETGKSRRWVQLMITWLETHGWIEVEHRSGHINRYLSEPAPSGRGFILKRSTSAPECATTGAPECATTGAPECAGQPISPYRLEELRKKGKEGATPHPISAASQTGSLFADGQRRWLKAGADYLLAEQPELAEMRKWLPGLVAEFFLAQSWQRSSDPETAVVWAKGLAAIAATEGETAAAFAWALATPSTVFSRPDHLRRIVGRIKSQRVQARVAERAIEPTTDDRERARALLAEHLRKRGQEAKR